MITSQNIFLFFLFFPQINFGIDIFDSTPYAFITGLFYIFVAKIKISKYIIITYFLLICYILITNLVIEQLLNYELIIRQILSVSTVIVVLTILGKIDIFGHKFQKTLLSFTLIYFGGVILQSLGFTLESVSHNRTGGGRGFTSFASEATYLGLFSLVFIIYFFELINSSHEKNNYLRLGLIFSFINLLLSSSAMALLLTLVYVLTRQINIRIAVIFSCLGVSIYYYSQLTEAFASFRVFKLIETLINERSVFLLMMQDGSISERISAVIFPYMGLWENNFLPGGSNTYEIISDKFRSEFVIFWWGSSSKIMNYFGTFVYELGFICIIPGMIWLLRLMFISVKNRNIGLFIFMIAIFNTGLPPMAAIFTFFLVFNIKLLTKVNM